MKNLFEVRRGIYCLDGADIRSTEEFTVAVHPFFEGKYQSRKYLSNVYEFLRIFPYPILTLEEADKFETTVAKYRKIGNKFNRFFVKTEASDPTPLEIEMKNVIKFIEEFKPLRINAIGGYTDDIDNIPNDIVGCLDITIEILRKNFEVNIIKECTFGNYW